MALGALFGKILSFLYVNKGFHLGLYYFFEIKIVALTRVALHLLWRHILFVVA